MTQYKNTGRTVQSRKATLPCGKVYDGKKITVNKLVEFHKKVCDICKNSTNDEYTYNKRCIYCNKDINPLCPCSCTSQG